MQPQTNNEELQENAMSLRDYWDFFFHNWYWFLISAIACLGLARLYLATKNNVYQRQAVMLVKEENGASAYSRRSDALMQINGMMGGSGVANETFILGSRQLAREVARQLHLDVVYSFEQKLKTISLYDEKPFEVQFFDEQTIPATMKLKVLSDTEAEILTMQWHPLKAQGSKIDETHRKVKFGERIETEAGTFTIIPNPDNLKNFKGKVITVTHLNEESATNSVASRISASEVNKMATLVRIVCTDTNIKRADDILYALIEAYKRSIVEDKNKVAENTMQFIEERLRLVEEELDDVEGDLASFKEANKLVDVAMMAQNNLAQSSAAHLRTLELQKQQGIVKYMLDYLRKNSKGDNLIPALGGLADGSIQTQIAKYNELQMNRNRLAEIGSENSVVADLDANLSEMRRSLIVSMEGYANSVDLQVEQALKEEAALQSDIRSMPQQEKQALDIVRQQEIKQTLYNYLLNKREETALQLAVNEPNVRVVEQPYGSRTPISPRRSMVMLIGLVIGLALPFVFYYIYSLFNTSVRGRKDIEAFTKLCILGEVPRSNNQHKDSGIVVSEQSDDVLSESIRMMRYNLNFVNKDARVLLFTSTLPGEGKSFVNRNLAYSLATGNRKVVFVDCDIRRRTQTMVMGKKHAVGLTTYLSGATDDVESLIVKPQEHADVHFLPAGPMPPNPTELLSNDCMGKLIEELKKSYDYVLLDSVPAQMMADAAVLSALCDLTVYVIRDRGIDRRYLPELERMRREGRFGNMCVVVNDARAEKNSVGSYYGYGYKYGYSYSSDNGKKRKGLLGFLRRKKK